MQIIDAEFRNPVRRLRRKVWTLRAERQRLRMLKDAAGLQCSGTPCFDHYRTHNPNTLLFFDNRVRHSDVVSANDLENKLRRNAKSLPLRLVFGGRLIAMKGVLDLPRVAAELRRLNTSFTFDIYGAGILQTALEDQIDRLGLRDCVFLKGVMDFRDGWIPMLKRDADLFVCCHPQGDPSSTYPEVMSCGVPIAGYDNEAFLGIVRESGCGWPTPVNRPRMLAAKIAALAADRGALATAARRGREFALAHAFEATFARRTNHLVALSRLPLSDRPASVRP
jgi:glycosyltransferase involved in cell wall biosynthesis